MSVYFADRERACVAGNGGFLVCTIDGGTTWTTRFSGTKMHLKSVSFADRQRGCAAGNGGTLVCTTDGGATWNTRPSGTGIHLSSVSLADRQRGCAAGDSGILICTTDGGATWSPRVSGTVRHLRSVSFADRRRGCVAGNFGTLVCTTDGGSTWTTRVSGTTFDLKSVSFDDDERGCAVGAFGALVSTTDGGATWANRVSGSRHCLWSVSFPDSERGFAVGDGGTLLVRPCDAGRAPTGNHSTCESCPAGLVRKSDQSICQMCPVGLVPTDDLSDCRKCSLPGTEPNLNRTQCIIPSRWQFLVATAPYFLPIDGLVVAGTLASRAWPGHFHSKGYHALADEGVTAYPRHWRASRSRAWDLCPCLPQLRRWPWWVLAVWDVVDWALFFLWFWLGAPEKNQGAEFDADVFLATLAAALLFTGPVLPMLVLVLPRWQYITVEIAYDVCETMVVAYAQLRYSFRSGNLVLGLANLAATLIDGILLKGPEHLDDLLQAEWLLGRIGRVYPSLVNARQTTQASFKGRHVPEQCFSVVSFPGVEMKLWEDTTAGEDELEDASRRIAIACVFFPDGDPLFGKHSAPCRCWELYERHHPDFEKWEDGLAPWGCAWFAAWRPNVQRVLDAGQTPVVVYKRGMRGQREGLGFSQRGEVEWLHLQAGAEGRIRDVDVDEYLQLLVPRAYARAALPTLGDEEDSGSESSSE